LGFYHEANVDLSLFCRVAILNIHPSLKRLILQRLNGGSILPAVSTAVKRSKWPVGIEDDQNLFQLVDVRHNVGEYERVPRRRSNIVMCAFLVGSVKNLPQFSGLSDSAGHDGNDELKTMIMDFVEELSALYGVLLPCE
jgi:hypothetical protein